MAAQSAWLKRRLQQTPDGIPIVSSTSRVIDAEWHTGPDLARALQEGSFLDLYSKSIVSDFLRQPCAEHLWQECDGPTTLTYATMCSGSDICCSSLTALSGALKVHNIDVNFSQRWACESDPIKQNWLKRLHHGNDICIFEDAKDMAGSSKRAQCVAHGRCCLVQGVDCFMVGFSCKEFSRANTSASASKAHLLKTGVGGSSVETYKSMMAHIELYKPRFIIIENSDALCDGSDKVDANVNVLMGALSGFGYDSQAVILNTPLYGLPNRRPRTYIMAVLQHGLSSHIRSLDQYFKDFIFLLARAKREPPSALDVLLPEDNQFVVDCLSTRQGKRIVGWERGSIDIHQRHYAAKGLRWGSVQPDTSTKRSKWFGTLTAREKDCLVCNMNLYPEDEAFDISQSIYRVPKSSRLNSREAGIVVGPAILPRALIWWRKAARLQVGLESLMFAGFPIARRPDLSREFSNDQLQNLAGNCFSATIISAIFACYLAVTPREVAVCPLRRARDVEHNMLDESESQADSSQTIHDGWGPNEAVALLRELKRARSG